MKYIIANWKANKTAVQAVQWCDDFLKNNRAHLEKIEVIICPSYPFLPLIKQKLAKLPFVKIGAQDVSFFSAGAYTGEVAAATLSGLVDYVLVGHSERRQYCAETAHIVFQKTARAIEAHIQPIFCIRDAGDLIPSRVRFIAYEPVDAIGTGQNETIEKIIAVKKTLRLDQKTRFIYGGSVNEANISDYMTCADIDGLLVGSASLDAHHLTRILQRI